jgi:phosphate transport system substrate-binding protein
LKRIRSLLFVFGLLLIVQVAHAQAINGAGSTFINPIMTHWIDAFGKKTHIGINYQAIGSGGGINALTHQTVDFAGSDVPMNAQETAECRAPVLHLPVVIGAVVIAYNEPSIPDHLKLNGFVVSQIFLGRITFWDDLQIVRLNPDVKLPHIRIAVAHRSDGSGTSYIFTEYLAKVAPEWKLKVGVGKSVSWPVGWGGKGNAGVAGLLKTRTGCIGYCELAYALENHIKFAMIQNAKGKFILPSAESAEAAAVGVIIPANLCASLTNTTNVNGYPITGFSYLIVMRGGVKPQLKDFLNWIITSGQSFAKPLAYAPIPNSLVIREVRYINTLQ